MDKTNLSKPKSFLERIKGFFSGAQAGEHAEELEAALIQADVAPEVAAEMTALLRSKKITDYEKAREHLKNVFREKLSAVKAPVIPRDFCVILLTGVNGAGKTTAASKMAALYKAAGKKVLMIAADTFRAAAVEQLASWGERTGTAVHKGATGADPASVVFDGMLRAKKEGYNLVIADTAGRLQNKENLMSEMAKIKRVILRETPEEKIIPLIVIDANTGGNAYGQAKEFAAAVGLKGVILTKYDSTARGGSVIKISSGLNLPVVFLTFGEQPGDIEEFEAGKFVEELFN